MSVLLLGVVPAALAIAGSGTRPAGWKQPSLADQSIQRTETSGTAK